MSKSELAAITVAVVVYYAAVTAHTAWKLRGVIDGDGC